MDKNMILEEFYKNLEDILEDICIKDSRDANEYESIGSIHCADEYKLAIDDMDDFGSYEYDEDSLIEAKVPPELISRCITNNDLVPDEIKSTLFRIKHDQVINTFVETNDYYRALNGLPNMDDSDYIYLDAKTITGTQIDFTKAIHEMSVYDIDVLTNLGVIKSLKEKYTDDKYKYLNFLGRKSIDIIYARSAEDYTILRMGKCDSIMVYNSFRKFYAKSKIFILKTLYNKFYDAKYYYYKSVLKSVIVFMTIQNMIINEISIEIDRDFYDNNRLVNFLERFGIDFAKELPLNYQKILAKNLNYLLKYKGTDKVIIDICKLFGFEDMQLFKLYINKHHNTDSNGNLIFNYTKDEKGNAVENVDFMYKLNFISVPYGNNSLDVELRNSTNKIDYDYVTENDNYWGGGETSKAVLKHEILKKEFNYALTKYISLKNMFDITTFSFETSYFFNMVLQLKNEMPDVKLNFKKITNKPISLYDITIFLFAAICKKLNYTGEIISDFNKVLYIKGFNFETDISYIRSILESANIKDLDISGYKIDMLIKSTDEFNNIFVKNREVYRALQYRLRTTKDLNEYRKLKIVYEALNTTKYNANVYKKEDGSIAKSYIELLRSTNPWLFEFLDTTQCDKIDDVIEYVLHVMEDAINSEKIYKYIFIKTDSSTHGAYIRCLKLIVNFFKSRTVDLSTIDIVYILDDKFENTINVLDSFAFNVLISDFMTTVNAIDTTRFNEIISYIEKLTSSEFVTSTINIFQNENLSIMEKIKVVISNLDKYEFVNVMDTNKHIANNILKDTVSYKDTLAFV